MMEISVIICVHNPRADYLRRTLAGLRNQLLPKDRWEVLLIDNASAEPLAHICDLSWHPNARIIVETQLGLSPARQRGMREASANLLVFVDDDNVLDPRYLDEALEIGRNWPQLGTWGAGFIIPEYEQKPASHLTKLLPCLALREVTTARWGNTPSNKETTPWGAGLCVRAHVAREYIVICENSAISITGRSGKHLLSGDDVEISLVACKLGLGMGIFPELRLIHLIPRGRVMADYLLRIAEGTLLSDFLLAYKWRGVVPRSPFSFWGFLSFIKNAFLKRGIDRQVYFSHLRATIAARRVITDSSRAALESDNG
jgi:glycosyltransferase involved in cell wall biosynthesis